MSRESLLKALNFLKSSLNGRKEAKIPLAQLEAIIAGETISPQESEAFPLPPEVQREGGLALFSDGACRGNPGPGAWGMMGQDFQGKLLFQSSGVELSTTNNRMELMGAIQALKEAQSYCRKEGTHPPLWLYSDSRYLVDGMNSWIFGWERKGWKTSKNRPVENADLWREIQGLRLQFKRPTFVWVKGHAGHPQNEYCDQLANQALDEL